MTDCRRVIGKLNWVATQTRPDLSFDVSCLSSVLKSGKLENIKIVNKVTRKAKKERSQISITSLSDLNKISIRVYTDSSFANLEDSGSQGGYMIFAVGPNNAHIPLSWQSRKIRRLAKSTQAAETLAMVDALEASIYYRKFILELLNLEDNKDNVQITCKTDNNAVFSSVNSSTQILDKRLRIEAAILRELLETKEIHSVQWVPTDCQIADSLTKSGVQSSKVLDHTCGSRTYLP